MRTGRRQQTTTGSAPKVNLKRQPSRVRPVLRAVAVQSNGQSHRFNVRDYAGSVQAAIDAAARSGGGQVVIPAGKWTTGDLQLRCSDITLSGEDATLTGRLILLNCQNVSIRGLNVAGISIDCSRDVVIQDIVMDDVVGDALAITLQHPSSSNGKLPTCRNLEFRNISCRSAKTAVRMTGSPESALRNITLENVTISASEGLTCSWANKLELRNVKITPQYGPVLCIRDSQEVLIEGLNRANGTGVFLDLRGRQTRKIRLRSDNTEPVRPTVVLGVDVPTDALVHE